MRYRRALFAFILPFIAVASAAAQFSSISGPILITGRNAGFVGSSVGGNSRHGADAMSYVQVTSQTQILGNGVQVHRRSTMKFWQDADGRTRMDQYQEQQGEMRLMQANINDPVAKININLHERSRVADVHHFPVQNAVWKPSPNQEAFAKATLAEYQQPEQKLKAEYKSEDLGTSTILGETAKGQRQITIIPAGLEGNDSELRTTFESWTSVRTGLCLRNVNDDPRFGRTVVEIMELHLEAPDPALFKPPADYQVFDLTPPAQE